MCIAKPLGYGGVIQLAEDRENPMVDSGSFIWIQLSTMSGLKGRSFNGEPPGSEIPGSLECHPGSSGLRKFRDHHED